MKGVHFCICEDSREYGEKVSKFIKSHYRDVFVDIYDDETITLREVYDVYVLDVELKTKSGFELAEEIHLKYPNAIIVYLTSHEELARKGYLYYGAGFVSKAYFEEEFKLVLDKIMTGIITEKLYIPITHNRITKVLCLLDVYYITTEGHYIVLKTKDNEYRKRISMKKFLETYPTNYFYENCRGECVNLHYIKSFNSKGVQMCNGRWLQISKKKRKPLEERYNEYFLKKL